MAAHNAPEDGTPLVSLIVRYINGHYAESLSLNDLAAIGHVSKYYLSHEFSRVMGTSVYRFITLKRLQIARELLLRGASAGEAAARCGFHDYPNFFRTFRARYNYSPSACAATMAEEDIEPAAANCTRALYPIWAFYTCLQRSGTVKLQRALPLPTGNCRSHIRLLSSKERNELNHDQSRNCEASDPLPESSTHSL